MSFQLARTSYSMRRAGTSVGNRKRSNRAITGAKALENGSGSRSKLMNSQPSHSAIETGCSGHSFLSKPSVPLMCGAPISLPSSAYVHAWYGHWMPESKWPCAFSHRRVPRCRHTLWKARNAPPSSRVMMTLSVPTTRTT